MYVIIVSDTNQDKIIFIYNNRNTTIPYDKEIINILKIYADKGWMYDRE